MKLKIVIDLSSNSFKPCPGVQVGNILRKIIPELDHGGEYDIGDQLPIYENGSLKVGFWKVLK